MPMSCRLALAGALLLAGPLPLGAQSYGDVVAQFERNFFGADSANKITLKNQAILTLPRDDARYVDLMYSVIDRAETWYDQGLVFQYLTNVQGELRERLSTDLFDGKAHHSERVREAIAFMLYDYARFYRTLTEQELEAVQRGLKDELAGVRRYCALALQVHPVSGTVEALLAAWEKEKDVRVISAILESLRQLTGKRELARDLQEWQSWREGNPEVELTVGFGQPQYEVGTYGDLELEFDVSGSGRPIFVLPPQGYTNTIYRPDLSVLEDLGRLIYVRLPVVGQEIEIETDEAGNELYPVEALVTALEALRQEQKEDQVLLLGCQDTSWIILRYAQLHPEHVAGLIMVSGWLDREAYATSLELLKMKGNDEERLYVEVASGLQLREDLSQSQQLGVTIGKLASLHTAPTDLDACFMFETLIDQRTQGRVLIVPQAPLDKRKKIEVPSLIVHGKEDRWSAIKYSTYQGKLYFKPRPRVVEIKGSGPLPWLDNSADFHEQVEKFLKKL